jgi:hypothetical protein
MGLEVPLQVYRALKILYVWHRTITETPKKKPMFNRVEAFYTADIVALVAVRTPSEYRCVVLPLVEAEKTAQINLDRDYRTLTLAGASRSPNKTSIYLDRIPDVLVVQTLLRMFSRSSCAASLDTHPTFR